MLDTRGVSRMRGVCEVPRANPVLLAREANETFRKARKNSLLKMIDLLINYYSNKFVILDR